jgi:hypothetical protein
VLYPQYFYESLLKYTSGDPDFEFTVTTSPYPVMAVFGERERLVQTYSYIFMLSIALALIPGVIVS